MTELTLEQLLGSGGIGEAAGMLQEAEPRERRAVLGEAFKQITPFISPPGVMEAIEGRDMTMRDIMLLGVLGPLGGKVKKGLRLIKGGKTPLAERFSDVGIRPGDAKGPKLAERAFSVMTPKERSSLIRKVERSIDIDIGRIQAIENQLGGRPFTFSQRGEIHIRRQPHDLRIEISLVDDRGLPMGRIGSDSEEFVLQVITKKSKMGRTARPTFRTLGRFRNIDHLRSRLADYLDRVR